MAAGMLLRKMPSTASMPGERDDDGVSTDDDSEVWEVVAWTSDSTVELDVAFKQRVSVGLRKDASEVVRTICSVCSEPTALMLDAASVVRSRLSVLSRVWQKVSF